MRLENKIALVTGAGRGIGREIALTMAREGAFVIVNYIAPDEEAYAVVEEIKAAGGNAAVYKCNVGDFEAVKEMMTAVVKEYGRLDILVNNAGITRDNLMMRMTEAEFDQVIEANLKGTFNCIKHISRQMLKQRSGHIINMASVVGRSGNVGQINYSASKAGIIGMTMSAAKELASRGITVNAIAPGFVKTPMTDAMTDEAKAAVASQIPMGVLGEPKDIADLALFLASDEARYITGQVISCDGGMFMG